MHPRDSDATLGSVQGPLRLYLRLSSDRHWQQASASGICVFCGDGLLRRVPQRHSDPQRSGGQVDIHQHAHPHSEHVLQSDLRVQTRACERRHLLLQQQAHPHRGVPGAGQGRERNALDAVCEGGIGSATSAHGRHRFCRLELCLRSSEKSKCRGARASRSASCSAGAAGSTGGTLWREAGSPEKGGRREGSSGASGCSGPAAVVDLEEGAGQAPALVTAPTPKGGKRAAQKKAVAEAAAEAGAAEEVDAADDEQPAVPAAASNSMPTAEAPAAPANQPPKEAPAPLPAPPPKGGQRTSRKKAAAEAVAAAPPAEEMTTIAVNGHTVIDPPADLEAQAGQQPGSALVESFNVVQAPADVGSGHAQEPALREEP
mmetsp:Transcript_123837/g.396415  ORF Transcript_123837/g.396415 Transcript_123837/m.396415 type:complete len:373 (+) Transcript_123837:659-1777(+)